MPPHTILVVGSLNMDQVVQVPRLPILGETLPGAGSLKLVPGGKGANQAVAMARLGGHVAMAGRVGTDTFGEQLQAALNADQIDTTLVVKDQDEASGVAFIFLTPAGENAIVISAGANGHVGAEKQHYTQILAALDNAAALVLQLEIPIETVQNLIHAAHNKKVPVVLNLAPAQAIPPEILRCLSALIVNESEAALLSGQQVESIDDARTVATLLHQQGIETVVITLGERGALLVSTDTDAHNNMQQIYQPAPKVEVVDTTAAGDCFVGALTVALTEQQPPAKALQFAITASALKVTKFGAQSGLPTRAEVEKALASH
ncbi:MAG TPA: ribokinase [Dictyobacter sp.]|jgi:ribokinase|nr:ribokinase [Dictyobacter sp.]